MTASWHTAPDVLVIGAGVGCLTTAVCLAEAGLRVLIKADTLPATTTSAAAGAMWGPYLVEPRELVERWSIESLNELKGLAAEPATGVRMVTGVEVGREAVAPHGRFWGCRCGGGVTPLAKPPGPPRPSAIGHHWA